MGKKKGRKEFPKVEEKKEASKEEVKEEPPKESEEKKQPTVPGRTAIIDINQTYKKGSIVPELVVQSWESRGINVKLLVE